PLHEPARRGDRQVGDAAAARIDGDPRQGAEPRPRPRRREVPRRRRGGGTVNRSSTMKRIPNLSRTLLAPLVLAPLLLTLVAAVARAQASREEWHLMYFDDAKVGFVHGIREPEERGGRKLIRESADSSITINRVGPAITVIASGWSLEDEKGGIVEMYLEQNLSSSKTILRLTRDGDKGTIETRIGGPTQKRTIDWNKDWIGEAAADALRKEKLSK